MVCYKKSLKINPNQSYSNNNIAFGLFSQKKYKDALVYANKATKFDKNNADAFATKCVILYELKKYPQSLAAGEKAVKMGVKDKQTSDCIKKIKKILKK